jgi:hypothetical protein
MWSAAATPPLVPPESARRVRRCAHEKRIVMNRNIVLGLLLSLGITGSAMAGTSVSARDFSTDERVHTWEVR